MPLINLLASGVLAWGAPGPKFEVEVRYTEIANLTYELDVVCGLLPQVDADPFKVLWNERFLKADAARAQLATWKQIRNKYSASMSVSSGQFVSISNAIRVAGLRADDTDDYLGTIGLVMQASDVARVEDVLNYFAPTFHRWFEQEAKSKGKPFTTRLVKLWSGNPLRGDVESFARFYSPSFFEDQGGIQPALSPERTGANHRRTAGVGGRGGVPTRREP